MNNIIIGFGEIGRAVYKVIQGNTYVVDPVYTKAQTFFEPEVMHICFPYSETFVTDVKAYLDKYKPAHVIIYSTVPVGVTYQVSPWAVHSPVEGKHPDLEMSIRQMERWLGYNNKDEGYFFVNYFEGLGLKTKLVLSTESTEVLKLLSTTEYGINIEFARYKKRITDEIGMDYELTKEWNREYNKLYKNLGMEKRFQKFVLDAPEGPKGGHCIVPNARLLQEQFPDELVAIVGEIV
jgi:hypothetical protein